MFLSDNSLDARRIWKGFIKKLFVANSGDVRDVMEIVFGAVHLFEEDRVIVAPGEFHHIVRSEIVKDCPDQRNLKGEDSSQGVFFGLAFQK